MDVHLPIGPEGRVDRDDVIAGGMGGIAVTPAAEEQAVLGGVLPACRTKPDVMQFQWPVIPAQTADPVTGGDEFAHPCEELGGFTLTPCAGLLGRLRLWNGWHDV
jgi:hypothetical protein